jgi:hypothetical protein
MTSNYLKTTHRKVRAVVKSVSGGVLLHLEAEVHCKTKRYWLKTDSGNRPPMGFIPYGMMVNNRLIVVLYSWYCIT